MLPLVPVPSRKKKNKEMVDMESEDLGLSLGLSSTCTPTGVHLHWPPLRLSPPGDHGLRRIDVNRAPPSEVDEALSSPNSAASGVSAGKRAGREEQPGVFAEEPACSRGGSDDDDGSRKKLRLSKEQSAVLEESFKEHHTLNPKQKQALSKKLNLRPRQVEVWFQNRRARTKLKQTEVDCEYLRSCYENLTEENRRLQKEVQELRALKLSPHLYMHMTPPTTLTMCPACERVAASSSNSSRPS